MRYRQLGASDLRELDEATLSAIDEATGGSAER
jgi:hypothetical protein